MGKEKEKEGKEKEKEKEGKGRERKGKENTHTVKKMNKEVKSNVKYDEWYSSSTLGQLNSQALFSPLRCSP